ncbi:MAG: hypothetical protein JO061_14025 [Acidobacteriaceae bacterium]|nr:hypothetical protein [Acidobacteriaceae bacterium]
MLEQILSEVRGLAEQSDPPVRAAALLHLARVLTAFDQAEAEDVLEKGIALTLEIAKPANDALTSQAATLAAAVSPARALRLMPLVADPWHARAESMIFSMLRHGHIADAVSYLSEPPSQEHYPFSAATEAMRRLRNNEEARRNILRAAIRARLNESASSAEGFEMLFSMWFRILPDEEAAAAVRKIARRIIQEPDGETDARFSSGSSVAQFSSVRESRLFGIFGPLRSLDPEEADSLCRKYRQLAAAALVFPRGYHSEATGPHEESPSQQSAQCTQPDYITVGHHRLLPMPEALKTEFREPFDEALRLYARDTDPANPNLAPRECWPSALEFRNILYKAGQHEGHAAARHLNRIPDRDLRLFAAIELIAGAKGLPQFGGLSIPPRQPTIKKRGRWAK